MTLRMRCKNLGDPMGWKRWLGIGLIGLSGVWFAALILVPFTPFSLETKAILALLLLAFMEGSFWIGTLIVGKQTVSRFWKHLRRKSIHQDNKASQAVIGVGERSETSSERSAIIHEDGKENIARVIFMENLPYAIMTVLGMMVFLFGLQFNDFAWLLAGSYALYAFIGILWIIVFVCPYCHNFGSGCFSGHGQVSAKLMKKKDERQFAHEFKKNIPVIIPIYVIPIIAGVVSLSISFPLVVAIVVILFALNSFVMSPKISMNYACSHCSVRKDCPWMGDESMFSKRKQ
jgi:hypothetical protein